MSDQDYQELHTEVREAIRAGEAHDWRIDTVLGGYRCNNCLVAGDKPHGPTCPKAPADAPERDTRWTHDMMQEFVNEAQQKLSAGMTADAARMFYKNVLASPRASAAFPPERERTELEAQIDVWMAQFSLQQTSGAGRAYTAFLSAHQLLTRLRAALSFPSPAPTKEHAE